MVPHGCVVMLTCFQDRVSELPVGPQPPFFQNNLFSLLAAASIDGKPENSSFGDVLDQVLPVYRQVGHTASLWALYSAHSVFSHKTLLCS